MIKLLKFSKSFRIFSKKKKIKNFGRAKVSLSPQAVPPLFGKMDFWWVREENNGAH